MKEKTRMRKPWPFASWQYRQADEWLAGLAAQGWRLESFGFRGARFEMRETGRTKYRCVPHFIFDSYVEELRCKETFRKAGWSLVDDYPDMMVFAAEADADETGLPEYAVETPQILREIGSSIRIVRIWFAVWLFTAVLLIPSLVLLSLTKPQFVVSGDVLLLFLFYNIGLRTVQFVSSVRYLRRQRASIQNVENAEHPEKPAARRRFYGAASLAVFLVMIAHLVINIIPLDHVPPKSMPIVRLSEITGVSGIYTEKYDVRHGLLYPCHVDMRQDGDRFELQSCHALTPGLADFLAEQYAKEYYVYGLSEQEDAQGFDRLWLSGQALLAVSGNTMVYIRANEVAPMDIVPILRAKIVNAD